MRAEIDAINRLARHRQFLASFQTYRASNAQRVASGEGNGPADWLVLELTHNYFAVYDALTPKLGMLNPYYALRISQFYTYARAVTENYRPSSPFQTNLTAEQAVQALDNDIILLDTMHILGDHIASFSEIRVPRGLANPLLAVVATEQADRDHIGKSNGESASPTTDDLPTNP